MTQTSLKKIKKEHTILALLILAVLIGCMFWFGHKEKEMASNHHRRAEVTRVAVDLSPVEFGIDSVGGLGGVQYELSHILLGKEDTEWVPFTSREEALEALRRGEVDVYATSYPLTAADSVPGTLKSDPLYVSGFALVRLTYTAPWSEAFTDSTTTEVVIPKGANEMKMMLNHLRELSYPQLVIVEQADKSQIDLCLEVASGEILYTVCDRNLAHSATERVEGLTMDSDIGLDVHQTWLVSDKKPDLRNRINQAIDDNKGSDEWLAVLRKYGIEP